jgi:hypothetical protein
MKRKQEQVENDEWLDSREMLVLANSFHESILRGLSREEMVKLYKLVSFLVKNYEFVIQRSNDASSSSI